MTTDDRTESQTYATAAALPELTAREGAFVLHYLRTGNATEAAREAGYSERTARKQGSEVLARPRVQRAVQALQAARAERLTVDADWVIRHLVEVTERCLEAVPVLDEEGQPTGVYKFDSRGANGALRLIGQHLGMFRTVVEKRNATVEEMVRALAEKRRAASAG